MTHMTALIEERIEERKNAPSDIELLIKVQDDPQAFFDTIVEIWNLVGDLKQINRLNKTNRYQIARARELLRALHMVAMQAVDFHTHTDPERE